MIVRAPTIEEALAICRNARPDEQEQYYALTGKTWNPERVVHEICHKQGPKWVALDGDKPFIMGGYDHVVNDVWQSWMVGTMADWRTHWRSITKVSRKVMDALLATGARRLQTCVLASREQTCEWYVRALKMTFEGNMRGFGANGETMAMYARVKE